MIGQIEHCIAQHDHQIFIFMHEDSGQWMILSFRDDVLSRPLPELRLSCPEWLRMLAYDQGGMLLLLSPLLLCFSFTHKNFLTYLSTHLQAGVCCRAV